MPTRAPLNVQRTCAECGTLGPMSRAVCPHCGQVYVWRREEAEFEGEGTFLGSCRALVRIGPRAGVLFLLWGLATALVHGLVFGNVPLRYPVLAGVGVLLFLPRRWYGLGPLIEPVWEDADCEGSERRAKHFARRKAQERDLWLGTIAVLSAVTIIHVLSIVGEEAEADSAPRSERPE